MRKLNPDADLCTSSQRTCIKRQFLGAVFERDETYKFKQSCNYKKETNLLY